MRKGRCKCWKKRTCNSVSRQEAHKFTLALGTILGEPWFSAAMQGPRCLLSWALRPHSVDRFQEGECHTEGRPLLKVQPGLGPAASSPSVLLPEAGLLAQGLCVSGAG